MEKMRGELQRIAFMLILGLGFLVPSMKASDNRQSEWMTFLDDHGDWMTSSDYGPVWRPDIQSTNKDWQPFLNGQWLYTDCGWLWESRDPFGWLTCHFGRWQWIAEGGVGWIWVAGDEWASAWVAWRESEDSVGWGALPPRGEGILGRSPWETAVPDWGAFLFVPHQRLMAWDVGRYTTRGDTVPRAVTEDARLVTVVESKQNRWRVAGPGLTKLDLPLAPVVVEFVERLPTPEEMRKPFVGGETVTAYAPRLDLKKAFAWVPGDIVSLDALLLEAERRRLASQREADQRRRESRVIPRQPVYRVPENRRKPVIEEPVGRVRVVERVREPVIIYEQIDSGGVYHVRQCRSDCGCPKCRPTPPIPDPGPGNEAQREQRARQFSAQEAQRERQRAAQERARQGRDPNSPRVPLGPGL